MKQGELNIASATATTTTTTAVTATELRCTQLLSTKAAEIKWDQQVNEN